MTIGGRTALVCLGLCGSLACLAAPAAELAATPEAEPVGPSVVVEAAPVQPQCMARSVRGSLSLVPDEAEWLVHVSPRAVMQSSAWQLLSPRLTQDGDWLEAEGVFMSCGQSFDRIDHLLVGLNEDEEFVAVLAAPDIGKPEHARCLIMAIQRASGEAEAAEVVALPGNPELSIIQFTDGRAYLLADDLLALTTSGWQDEVGRLGRCESAGAVQRSLLDPMRGVDINAPLWAAGRPGPEFIALIEGSLGALSQLRTCSANIGLDGGIELSALLDLGDPQSAIELSDSVSSMIQLLGTNTPQGLTQVLTRTSVEARGASVELRTGLTTEELRLLMSL